MTEPADPVWAQSASQRFERLESDETGLSADVVRERLESRDAVARREWRRPSDRRRRGLDVVVDADEG